MNETDLSTVVTEQTGPTGGSDLAGNMPRSAVAAIPVGIATVRVLPTLESAAGAMPGIINACFRLLGKSPLRRRVHITSDVAIWLGNTEQLTRQHSAFRLPANTVFSSTIGGELWVSLEAAGTVTFWSEQDAG